MVPSEEWKVMGEREEKTTSAHSLLIPAAMCLRVVGQRQECSNLSSNKRPDINQKDREGGDIKYSKHVRLLARYPRETCCVVVVFDQRRCRWPSLQRFLLYEPTAVGVKASGAV